LKIKDIEEIKNDKKKREIKEIEKKLEKKENEILELSKNDVKIK
jgi:gamma-glutamyl phosphate reductase